MRRAAAFLAVLLFLGAGQAQAEIRIEPTPTSAAEILTSLDVAIGGRVRPVADGWIYQWPGVHFEASFVGEAVVLRIGSGPQILAVLIDGVEVDRLVATGPGDYRVSGLAPGEHRIRVDLVSEHQAQAAGFGGLFVEPGGSPLPREIADRQIEFIGDSHSVGYGVRSDRRDCTPGEIWAMTDTRLAFGPLTAGRFDADYQVNAISGRGIVRNYAGFVGPTLPQAYPYDLFDANNAYADPAWRPLVVAVNLGTNDFSTALGDGEPWTTREELRDAFEAGYVRFVQNLRSRHPQAFLILLAPPSADDEIGRAVAAVSAKLAATGENRVAVLPLPSLERTACDWHPSIRDQQAMAGVLSGFLMDRPEVWTR